MNRVDVVTCITWVPKGKAKPNPDKVELTEDELQKIIEETKDTLDDLELDEEQYDNAELEASVAELHIKPSTSGIQGANNVDEEMKELETNKFEKEYDLNDYDNEAELNALKLGHLVVHANSSKDPYLQTDDDSDAEDDMIKDSDNLIVAGRFEGEAASVEAYIFNADNGYYIHHDFLLPAPPLCIEWLNYDSTDENLAPGNLIAVGDMTPAINVWDLNCIGSIEPAYTLGYKKKRKKDKSDKEGHSKRVVSLAWNAEMEHILASGSVDETVILWDLQKGTPAATLNDFSEKIQALKWNPIDNYSLLTGCCDKYVRLFDCRSNEVVQRWKVKGEVESLVWSSTDKNIFMASTDRGYVYVVDTRHQIPKYHFKAHESTCSGIAMNKKCPGCLVTVGEDSYIKIWDLSDTDAELLHQSKSKLGSIRAVTASPDDPFVYAFGGDGSQSFKVWDIRHAPKVRQINCPKLNLPVDDNEKESSDSDFESEEEDDGDEIVNRLKNSLNKDSTAQPKIHKKKIAGRLKKK